MFPSTRKNKQTNLLAKYKKSWSLTLKTKSCYFLPLHQFDLPPLPFYQLWTNLGWVQLLHLCAENFDTATITAKTRPRSKVISLGFFLVFSVKLLLFLYLAKRFVCFVKKKKICLFCQKKLFSKKKFWSPKNFWSL